MQNIVWPHTIHEDDVRNNDHKSALIIMLMWWNQYPPNTEHYKETQ